DQRLVDLLQQHAVDGDAVVLDDEVDLLAQRARGVAHDAAVALENVGDGDQARLERALLELLDQALEDLDLLLERGRVQGLGLVEQAGLHHGELLDEVHDAVELLEADAHRRQSEGLELGRRRRGAAGGTGRGVRGGGGLGGRRGRGRRGRRGLGGGRVEGRGRLRGGGRRRR